MCGLRAFNNCVHKTDSLSLLWGSFADGDMDDLGGSHQADAAAKSKIVYWFMMGLSINCQIGFKVVSVL